MQADDSGRGEMKWERKGGSTRKQTSTAETLKGSIQVHSRRVKRFRTVVVTVRGEKDAERVYVRSD